MLRTHTCGDLRISDVNKKVTICGWVQKTRDKGGMMWVDLRDRYGITQLIVEEGVTNETIIENIRSVGREYVLQITGTVKEREAKNDKMATGDIELLVEEFKLLNPAKLPPFLIEDNTDGGDELRMKYRYLDLRRNPVREKLRLRHKIGSATRQFLDNQDFIEVETPVLIKSTPEGARDFVVPSRMNQGEFYALPQSPQTFKQLLMISGFDRYYQIVKCFRDEDLRADRQPEFTQIDCEMSFVEQEDILNMFEGLIRHLFKVVKDIDLSEVPRMYYADAMKYYGSDKPDTRFDMRLVGLNELVQNKGFGIFDAAELIVGINATGAAAYTRKEIDALTEWIKRPQIGAKGLVYLKYNEDGTTKSSVDKFYSEEDRMAILEKFDAKPGDMILMLSGDTNAVRKQMNELRLEMGQRLGLRDASKYSVLWVLDFPLLEFDEESNRWHAMHHPFTSPKPEDMNLINTDPGAVRANAYDMVINGTEVGGGSVRIFEKPLQQRMFDLLGFTPEEAEAQFGFLMSAFEYGAPPHAGIAFGFDRLCSLFGGVDSIRDFIAFPKNNSGRDVMIDSPSPISKEQLGELGIDVKAK
jgi:aspartyl-tRNA synthetase